MCIAQAENLTSLFIAIYDGVSTFTHVALFCSSTVCVCLLT